MLLTRNIRFAKATAFWVFLVNDLALVLALGALQHVLACIYNMYDLKCTKYFRMPSRHCHSTTVIDLFQTNCLCIAAIHTIAVLVSC